MPTFTSIALDSLLEPRTLSPAPRPPPVPVEVERPAQRPVTKKSIPPSRPNISPTLYTTPETTPLPDSPPSFPPSSPYVINHKRRGPRLLKSFSAENDIGTIQLQDGVDSTQLQNGAGATQPLMPDTAQRAELVNQNGGEVIQIGFQDRKVDGEQNGGDAHGGESEAVTVEIDEGSLKQSSLDNELVGAQDLLKPVSVDPQRDSEVDDFFDPQDSLSTASNTEVDDSYGPGQWKPTTTSSSSEYYDAFEDISSDDATRSSYQNIEELREMRLNLLTEIERRKQAEEALENLQIKWQMLSHHFSLVGLKLRCPPTITDEIEEHSQSNVDPVEDLCQQVIVARFVADAVGRACSRAQVEMEIEPQIEVKNYEIARLWDRLQFYETANTEMCHRNQEAVELARQHRNRRRRRQKWFWSSIGLVVTLGTAAIAWSYIPASRSSPAEGDSIDSNSSGSIN